MSEERIQRALEHVRTALRGRSQHMSVVREAIVRAALRYEGHFSVDDLLRVLRKERIAGAHLATIYRAIPLLLSTGIIQPALVAKGEGQRYEAAFEQEHHDHLVCTDCGAIVEFQSDALERLQREIAAEHGYELASHTHELLGRCKDCRHDRRVSGRSAR